MRLSAIGTSTPSGSEQLARPGAGREHDAVAGDVAVGRAHAAHAAALRDQRRGGAAEPRHQSVRDARGEPAEDHLVRVREAAVGLVGARPRCRRARAAARSRRSRTDRRTRCRARAPRAAHVVAAGVGQRLRHGQQVAGLDVAGVADADLLGPAHDRLGAAHREQRGDGVRVVAAHHAERAAGVAGAERVALEQDDAPRAAEAEVVRDRRSEEPAADHDDVCAFAHGGGVSRARRCDGPPPTVRTPWRPWCRVHGTTRCPSPAEPSSTRARSCRGRAAPTSGTGSSPRPRRSTRRAVEAIARFEPVTVIARPGTTPRLPAETAHEVDVLEIPIDDSWVRDNGPIFVVDGQRRRCRGGLRVQRLGRQVRAVRGRRAAAGEAAQAARDAALRGAAGRRGRRADARRRGHR